MPKNRDWSEDVEALDIATKLIDKYPKVFDGLDLTRVRFVRNMASASRVAGEVKPCSFPYDIDSPYAYYIIINNSYWKSLSEAQQTLAVMHLIYAIAPGGTDETSTNYARTRRHDIKDYNLIMAAAGGRYDWAEPGKTDLPNPLTANEDALLEKISAE